LLIFITKQDHVDTRYC